MDADLQKLVNSYREAVATPAEPIQYPDIIDGRIDYTIYNTAKSQIQKPEDTSIFATLKDVQPVSEELEALGHRNREYQDAEIQKIVDKLRVPSEGEPVRRSTRQSKETLPDLDPETQKIVNQVKSAPPNKTLTQQIQAEFSKALAKPITRTAEFKGSGSDNVAYARPMFFNPIHSPQTWKIPAGKITVPVSADTIRFEMIDKELEKLTDEYKRNVQPILSPAKVLTSYERDVASVAAVIGRRGAVPTDKDRPATAEDIADMQGQLQSISNDPNLTCVTHSVYEHNLPIKLISMGAGPNANGDSFSGSGGSYLHMDGDQGSGTQITAEKIDAALRMLNGK